MSLHQLASHVQGAGRGQDKMLVHMTPGEVQGLQSLAMAHGGSLSINPETGLPEAGILGKLLPSILGFALGPAGFGIMSATQAGLATGLVGTLATGSLGKGIMAGMGAYSGANLGEALKGVGTAAVGQKFPLTPPSPEPTLSNVVAPTPVNAAAVAKRSMGELDNILAEPPKAAGFGSDAQLAFRERNLRPDISFMRPPEPGQAYNLAGTTPVATPAPPPPTPTVEDAVKSASGSFSENMSAAGKGVAELFKSPEKAWQFVKDNPVSVASLAASIYSGMQEGPPAPPERAKLKRFRYEYDRQPIGVASSRSSERNYFPNARMVDTGEYYSANGGLMSLANGGPVEEMSRLNTIGANTGYPMSNQMSSTYASPAERPISENIIHPQGDANVDPYTGAEKFAEGGYTRYTGTRPLDEDKDDYYYVPGTAAGSGYYMIRNTEPSGTGGYDPSNPFGNLDLSYNPATGGIGGGKPAKPAPLSTRAAQQTRETLNPMYQKYFGRDIDPEGLAAYTAQDFSPAELDKIFTGSEEYKAAAPVREAAAKEASYATADQAADIYERVMGRTPDLAGLEYYAKTNRMTPEEMEKSLRGSDEYFKNLTKPFVPAITYGDNGRASIEGAPKYDPSQYGFAAGGGISDLGGYSDGGRLLKGPGDGVSDSIPAVIGKRQPARLADGEFVIPARIVSELGNGSTEAGARKLYAMMERIQSARKKSVGKGKVAANTKSEKYLPA